MKRKQDDYARLGFAIFYIADNHYEVERIDEPDGWSDKFVVPLLSGDKEAKQIALSMGIEFNDVKFPYRVTNVDDVIDYDDC